MADDRSIFSESDGEVNMPHSSAGEDKGAGATLHAERLTQSHRETHGMRTDIDENTPLDDVRAPTIFERAKEEIEALVQTIHRKKHGKRDEISDMNSRQERKESVPENGEKCKNFIDKSREEMKAIMHNKKPRPLKHHGETHGMSDIDEKTPLDEVKAPNVFERAKEEIEALIQTLHFKK